MFEQKPMEPEERFKIQNPLTEKEVAGKMVKETEKTPKPVDLHQVISHKKALNNNHLRRLGISADELAEHLGISRNSAKTYLDGSRPCPYWTYMAARGISHKLRKVNEPKLLVIKVEDDEALVALRTVARVLKVKEVTVV